MAVASLSALASIEETQVHAALLPAISDYTVEIARGYTIDGFPLGVMEQGAYSFDEQYRAADAADDDAVDDGPRNQEARSH